MNENKLIPKKEKKKKKNLLGRLLADKKKRYFVMLAMMLPFIIGIIIFGSITLREINNLKNLANNTTEHKSENIVESMNYLLRDNPTDVQKEYFAQLKKAIEEGVVETEEGEVPADDAAIASLVAKNYVADFYTWTNKRGQYDIGGFYYIYDGEFENGDHNKENWFLKAREGFYKYIGVYGTQYGKENLLEVDNVEITKCQKLSSPYMINEHVENRQDEEGEWYDYREDHAYDCYAVTCNWTYKEGTQLDLSKFAKSINLAVIKRNNRFEIVEASEKTINARTGKKADSAEETSTGLEAQTDAETTEYE